ncbi:hypothetical protein [Pseudoruegeria sp. HB172150]|uniref:hypothetical protein n=1 Tax=Pseudoruegeria sp. HB172150 TaxID=2721164 RepID=UPI001551AC56|nr:hypothetical protein [Pseudoruegeria sp. HB172150]
MSTGNLKSRLKQLAETSVIKDNRRRLGDGSGQDLIAAILSEIDETVFPRRLTIRNDAEEVLCLDAASRRLQRLPGPVPTGLEDQTALFETDLFDPEPALLEQLRTTFSTFAGASLHLWVLSRELETDDTAAQTGLSAAMLAETWSLRLGPVPPLDPDEALDRFLDLLEPYCTAWALIADADLEATSDPAPNADQQDVLIATNWTGFAPAAGREPWCAVLGTTDSPVVLASYNGRGLYARADDLSEAEIMELWHSLGL